MTIIAAMGRIEQIQSTLIELSGVQAAQQLASSNASAGTFAVALAAALGTTGMSGTGVATGAGVTGTDVATAAQKYLGVPYVFGGEDATGMDCSGLVQRVFADMGVDVPRLVSGQMAIGTEVGSLADARPGDLIVTGGGGHISIYAGNNKVIHAPYPGRDVSLVDTFMTDADIDTIRRVVASESSSVGTAAGADLLNAALAALARGGSQ